MKKKILVALVFTLMSFTFLGCDLLSTINAVKGFYDEYQTYSTLYDNAPQMTVDTTTNLTIADTNIESIIPVNTHVYFMVDENSNFVYVEQTLNDVSKNSVYDSTGGSVIEYLIDDNNVVTPSKPAAEDQFNANVTIMNENFSYQSVSNENKTGDRTYEFDVYLNQAVNLDALSSFVNELKVFDETLSGFNNAIAHVIITFSDTDSTIDIQATVDNYTITFDDESTVTFSMTNHTILKIPTDFAMPDVFSSDYQMMAVDDFDLATKVYNVGDVVAYPVTEDENGWVQLNLDAGTYALESTHLADLTGTEVYDSDQTLIPFDETASGMVFTVDTAGTYYLYLVPTASFQSDLQVLSYAPTTDTTNN